MSVNQSDEKQKDEVEQEDTRIEDAAAMRRFIRTKAYEVLMKRWNEIRDLLHKGLLDETLSKDDLKIQQIMYNRIDMWIGLPEGMIQEGKDAETEKDIETRPTKKGIPQIERK